MKDKPNSSNSWEARTESTQAKTETQTLSGSGSATWPGGLSPWERQRLRDETESAAIERALSLPPDAVHPMSRRRRR